MYSSFESEKERQTREQKDAFATEAATLIADVRATEQAVVVALESLHTALVDYSVRARELRDVALVAGQIELAERAAHAMDHGPRANAASLGRAVLSRISDALFNATDERVESDPYGARR